MKLIKKIAWDLQFEDGLWMILLLSALFIYHKVICRNEEPF